MTKKMSRKFLLASLASGLCCFSIAVIAAPRSQTCELGNTCPIPGDDGGETHFNVTPSSGMDYVCEIKSEGDSLKFWLSSGKSFDIIQGSGPYNANPEATVEIKGRFKNPNDPNDAGEIKIARLPFSASGTVKCYAKQ